MTAWVLILFYFSGGSPSVTTQVFDDKPACVYAARQAVDLGKMMPGVPAVHATCVPKGSGSAK